MLTAYKDETQWARPRALFNRENMFKRYRTHLRRNGNVCMELVCAGYVRTAQFLRHFPQQKVPALHHLPCIVMQLPAGIPLSEINHAQITSLVLCDYSNTIPYCPIREFNAFKEHWPPHFADAKFIMDNYKKLLIAVPLHYLITDMLTSSAVRAQGPVAGGQHADYVNQLEQDGKLGQYPSCLELGAALLGYEKSQTLCVLFQNPDFQTGTPIYPWFATPKDLACKIYALSQPGTCKAFSSNKEHRAYHFFCNLLTKASELCFLLHMRFTAANLLVHGCV